MLPPTPTLPVLSKGEEEKLPDDCLYPAPVPVVRWQYVLAQMLNALALLVAITLILEFSLRTLNYFTLLDKLPETLTSKHQLKGLAPFLDYPFFRSEKRRELEILFNGDEKRKGRAAKLRAIWEAHPESKVYFASYACLLAADRKSEGSGTLGFFRQQMQIGRQLDPDNALYHYLLADRLGWDALENYAKAHATDPKTGRLTYAEYRVKNRRLLEEALAEIRRAVRKPYYRNYQNDVVNERIKRLPPPRCYEDHVLNLCVYSSTIYPDYPCVRRLAWMIPYYARVLAAEGREAEAIQLLDFYRPICRHVAHSSDSLLGILVAKAIEGIGGKNAPLIYDDLGRHDLAQQQRRVHARVQRFFDNWKSAMKQHETDEQQFLNRKANMLIAAGGPLLSPQRYFTVTELAPTRNLEYILMEQFSVGVLLVLLVVLLIHTWIASARWRLGLRRAENTPQWLALETETLTLAIFSIVLILFLYYAFTRWSGLAGRDNSYFSQRLFSSLEILVPFVLLAVVPIRIAIRSFRRRCEEYRIPVKGFRRTLLFTLASGLGLSIWFLLFAATLVLTIASLLLTLYGYPFHWYALSGLGACLFLAVLILLPGFRRTRLGEGLYRGTMARSLVPVYALAILLISAVAVPTLDHEEQYWLYRDTILFYHKGEPMRSMTPLEERVVKDLRGKLLQVLGETDRK
ncbi:MAG TPA: hypothetical protein VGM23_04800 [Armatimonadota bacterium]